MVKLGHDEMAKYPFLADSGAYLKEQGFTIEQFGNDPDLKLIIDKAYDRIKTAADGGIYKSELIDNQALNDSILPREVFSFLIAVILLKLSGMNTLIKRFALAESRLAEKYLEKDLGNASRSREELAKQIISELFGVELNKVEQDFTIPIENYVIHSVHFHEREWKLVNRRVEDGKVFLTTHETVRLIRRALSNYITTKIQSTPSPPMMAGFEESVKNLISMSQKFSTAPVTSTEYPPCIKHAIQVLEKGENLPHSGRFMIATFLLSRGQSVSQIAPIFKNAPDYNEKITLYQLNHLAGLSGSTTKYVCPSCDKLKSQNLCFAIPDCNNIINPLQFKSQKSKNA
jgi:DNA primase large subunit